MKPPPALAIVAALAGVAGAAPLDPPVARYAPKGRPLLAPLARPEPGIQPDALNFLYAAALQVAAGSGAGATVMQADPALGVGDFHSLAEIAVQSVDQMQIVE